MKWRCPHPDKARQKGCLEIAKHGLCLRKEWIGINYLKAKNHDAPARAEVYCERIKSTLHEE
jgi:hypothetical protein